MRRIMPEIKRSVGVSYMYVLSESLSLSDMTTDTNLLAGGLAAVGFPWFDDALAHAHWVAGRTGRRRRVCWDRRKNLWTVRPAVIVLKAKR